MAFIVFAGKQFVVVNKTEKGREAEKRNMCGHDFHKLTVFRRFDLHGLGKSLVFYFYLVVML